MRVNVNEAEKYGGQGGGGYFSLKNDKDIAKVRILYDSVEDVEGYAVHEVEIDGKKRYVNCLREYGAPVSDCPFCEKQKFQTVKYFLPIYNIETGTTQTWERGKKFGSKISSLCARYPHLVSHTFEIERNGKAGDQQTTYEIYETGQDNAVLEDFEAPQILGRIVLDKSADDMRYYLDRGVFPDDEGGEVRRRGSSDDREYTRRTPATDGDRRERDRF